MSKIGLHIRLTDSLTEIIEKALILNVPLFQTFFTFPTGKHIKINYYDLRQFLYLRRKYFDKLFLHGSYWINLCSPQTIGYKILEKEILMAKKAEFTHIILHPGSANGYQNKIEGIDCLAKSLNKITKYEREIKIVLENTTHGNLSIGGDLNDFKILLEKLNKPELINFCIDTAHAYSYGYNIANEKEQDDFISLIDTTIGKNNVVLIHLNDTSEKLGLKIDKHSIPGKGNIGENYLKRFLKHEFFKNIPALIELPNQINQEEEKNIIEKIKLWQ